MRKAYQRVLLVNLAIIFMAGITDTADLDPGPSQELADIEIDLSSARRRSRRRRGECRKCGFKTGVEVIVIPSTLYS